MLETERGFYSVLTHLLRERTTHREVRRNCGDLIELDLIMNSLGIKVIRLVCRAFRIFIVQQAEKIIENTFSSLKSKLHELKWIDQKTFQFVMQKVT